MANDLHIIGFRIGEESYGIPISLVREIVRVPDITAVPNAPETILGVINLRGKIVPVMDLRKRFGLGKLQTDKKSRILVVDLENRLLGLFVNSASEVLKIPASDVEPPASMFSDGESGYVTGVGKLRGRLIILLDIAKLLQRKDYRGIEEAAEPVGSSR